MVDVTCSDTISDLRLPDLTDPWQNTAAVDDVWVNGDQRSWSWSTTSHRPSLNRVMRHAKTHRRGQRETTADTWLVVRNHGRDLPLWISLIRCADSRARPGGIQSARCLRPRPRLDQSDQR